MITRKPPPVAPSHVCKQPGTLLKGGMFCKHGFFVKSPISQVPGPFASLFFTQTGSAEDLVRFTPFIHSSPIQPFSYSFSQN